MGYGCSWKTMRGSDPYRMFLHSSFHICLSSLWPKQQLWVLHFPAQTVIALSHELLWLLFPSSPISHTVSVFICMAAAIHSYLLSILVRPPGYQASTWIGVDLSSTLFGSDVGLLWGQGGVSTAQKNTDPSADFVAWVAEETAHHMAVNKHATFAAFESVPSKQPSVQTLIIWDAFVVAAAELAMDLSLPSHIHLVIA